jgi:hypothetical protein
MRKTAKWKNWSGSSCIHIACIQKCGTMTPERYGQNRERHELVLNTTTVVANVRFCDGTSTDGFKPKRE